MQLKYIPIPLWSPPKAGPWRMRWTRPNGDSGLGSISYARLEDAERDAGLCNRCDREACTYDVVPDPGGARWTSP